MTEKTMFLAEQEGRFLEMGPEGEGNDLAKLTGDDLDSNGAWADRLAAYDPGEIEAFDFREVMPQLGVEYGWT